MRIAVAITGASGVIIGFRLLEELASKNHTIIGIISNNAKPVIQHEIGEDYKYPDSVIYYKGNDPLAPLNSSSYLLDAMLIAPCSLKTLAAIAVGYTNSLITRTAENVLRTGSKLILVPRETPLSASALSNMLKLRNDGAIIFPPVAAYYHQPQSVNDMTNFFVGKLMDLVGIENNLYHRWNQDNK